MGVNKSKLRRERKAGATIQPPEPEQDRPIKPWVIRLIMMVPPVLYACYLVWDLNRQ